MEVAYCFICESVEGSGRHSDAIDAFGIFETRRFDAPSPQNRLCGQAVIALRLSPADAGLPFVLMVRAVDPDGSGIGSKAHTVGPILPRADGTVPVTAIFSDIDVPLTKSGDHEIEIHFERNLLKSIPVRIEFGRDS